MERLITHPFVNIFEKEIDRVWPLTSQEASAREERKRAIEEFAERNGLSVKITDLGFRVAFRKLDPNKTGSQSEEKAETNSRAPAE